MKEDIKKKIYNIYILSMNNIFFFIKYILGRHSPYLIYFIVFDLFPQADLQHFSKSICDSPFMRYHVIKLRD